MIALIVVGCVLGYAAVWLLSALFLTAMDRKFPEKEIAKKGTAAIRKRAESYVAFNLGISVFWPAALPICAVVYATMGYRNWLKKYAGSPFPEEKEALQKAERDKSIAEHEALNGIPIDGNHRRLAAVSRYPEPVRKYPSDMTEDEFLRAVRNGWSPPR